MNDCLESVYRNPFLVEAMALDKIQKRKEISDHEIKLLKNKNLIEGRKPNFYIAA